jgi:hypothetical protein
MKLKTLIGIIGLLIMTAFVFFGQTFCDFLNGDYGDWLNAALWTVITAVVLTTFLILAVVGMSKHGAQVQTWHVVGIVCFVLFVGASCFMAAPSVVHTFTVLSRKGDIADKAREIINNTDLMYGEYKDQSERRSNNLRANVKNYLTGNPTLLTQIYSQYNVQIRDTSDVNQLARELEKDLLQICDKTWGEKLRSRYEDALINRFSLLTGGSSLKNLIHFNRNRYDDFTKHFSQTVDPFETAMYYNVMFNYSYVDYADEVSRLFGNRSAHAGGIALFIVALLLGSCPFIFVKNNKVRSTRKAKGGEGIYSKGYPLK